MIDLSEFFMLSEPADPPWWWLDLAIDRIADDHEWNDLKNGVYSGPKPIPLKLFRGGNKPGIIGGMSRLTIISEDLLSTIIRCEPNGGVDYHPAVVYNKDETAVIDTQCVWIKLRVGCGPIDPTRGFRARFGRNADRSNLQFGFYFDPESWTGLDVFRSQNWHALFVTRRVADSIRQANIPGVSIESLPDIGRSLSGFWSSAKKAPPESTGVTPRAATGGRKRPKRKGPEGS